MSLVVSLSGASAALLPFLAERRWYDWRLMRLIWSALFPLSGASKRLLSFLAESRWYDWLVSFLCDPPSLANHRQLRTGALGHQFAVIHKPADAQQVPQRSSTALICSLQGTAPYSEEIQLGVCPKSLLIEKSFLQGRQKLL